MSKVRFVSQPGAPQKRSPRPARTPAPRRVPLGAAIAVVALVGVVAAAAGAGGRATYGARVTADEPQYLLTAISLAEDGDLDVGDELDAERHRVFHEADLPRQTAVLSGGARVSPHDPLLPVLLAPAVAVGGWLGAKLTLALVAGAVAALTCWTAVRRYDVPVPAAAVTTAVFAASAPLSVYGQQIYPELPAALAVLIAVAALTGPLRRPGLLAVLGAVVALPWLGIKYAPVAAVLAAIVVHRLWRQGRPRVVAGLCGTLVLAGLAYLAAHFAWYGGATVYAAGTFFQEQGSQLSVVGTQTDYLGRSRRLLGLLVDRSFGLAAWQPAWLLLVPATAALLRRRPAGWLSLAAPLATGWLVATFVAVTMHGWWFPGRQLVAVLPLAAIVVAAWIGTGAGLARRVTLAGLGALGIASHAWLVAATSSGRITWVVDFFATPDPWYRTWSLMLPDYPVPGVGTWVRHGVWLAAVAGAFLWSWWRAQPAVRPPLSPPASAATRPIHEGTP